MQKNAFLIHTLANNCFNIFFEHVVDQIMYLPILIKYLYNYSIFIKPTWDIVKQVNAE